MSGPRVRSHKELVARRRRRHGRWDHLVVAPLWPMHGANLGTLLRTCDAVGACLAVPRLPWVPEAPAWQLFVKIPRWAPAPVSIATSPAHSPSRVVRGGWPPSRPSRIYRRYLGDDVAQWPDFFQRRRRDPAWVLWSVWPDSGLAVSTPEVRADEVRWVDPGRGSAALVRARRRSSRGAPS